MSSSRGSFAVGALMMESHYLFRSWRSVARLVTFRQLQCQEAHECLFDVLESPNRLPWLGDEYALVIVKLQQGVQVTLKGLSKTGSMSAAFMGSAFLDFKDHACTLASKFEVAILASF